MRDADRAEFEAFVTAVWSRLFRTAHALTGNRHDAEDLMQSGCAKAYASWSKVKRADNPEAYVHRVIVNECYGLWRRRSRRPERTTENLPEQSVPSHDDAVDATTTVWEAIQKLPPRQRAVIVLRYFEDLSERDIASVLNIAPGTVKSQASNALKTLRRDLGDDNLIAISTLGESA